MKNLFLIAFATLYINFQALYMRCYATDTLPEKNLQMLGMAKVYMGKKVGTGICGDFVEQCIKDVCPTITSVWGNKYRLNYGKRVRTKKIKPGDIVVYHWRLAGKGAAWHTGIVYEIKNGAVMLFNQNVGCKLKNSRVVISPMTYGDEVLDHVRFYRPK